MAEELEAGSEATTPRQRRRHRRRALRLGGGVALVLAVAGTGLWLARKPIADRFIMDALRERGIAGSYRVAQIGPHTQRLENLVLGDPAHPDVTARFVEIDLAYRGFSIGVASIRASGVRLRGRVRDGALDLGALNPLLQGGDGPAKLPDIDLTLHDASLSLATDYGPVGLALDGRGNLASGFAGRLALASPALALADCRLGRVRAPLDITTAGGEIVLKGPLGGDTLACPAAKALLDRPRIDANLRIDPADMGLHGAFALAAAGAQAGSARLGRLSGLVTLAGTSERLDGSASIGTGTSDLGAVATGALKLGGTFALRPGVRDQAVSFAANLAADDLRPANRAQLRDWSARAAGTPLAPLADRLARALDEASHGNHLQVAGRYDAEPGGARLLVNGARFDATSGARIALDDGASLTLRLPLRAWTLDGALHMGGGGLPEADVTLARAPGGGVSGKLVMAPYAAKDARLALTPVDFALAADGRARIKGGFTLDGPIGDGAVRQLSAPVDLQIDRNGTPRLAGDCLPLRWQGLRISTASFDPAAIRLCGLANGRVTAPATQLTGKIGSSPLRIALDNARYDLASGRFAIAALATRIGAAESPVRLDATNLTGNANGAGFAGALSGGTAHIGTVPLDLSEIDGDWRFANGRLNVAGSLRVADSQADRRFNPLVAPDAKLELADGRITATGTLVHPTRKVDVAKVDIVHQLGTGAGEAVLDLGRLQFGGALQPDDLTPLSLGIVANVEGAVTGSGRFRWTADGVTSTGDFATQNMAFAAAFGPVSGFSTALHFDDLIGLRTAPHQRMTIQSANPGIDVRDGEVFFALESNEQARIEGGRWPFSGGTLDLLPTTLNLDARRPRHLAFRVTGLDAGAFINTLELDNISATGTYDGLLPMVFDEHGGRIEGGILVARQIGLPPLVIESAAGYQMPCDRSRQAGTLSYVGEVSNAQLNAISRLAFDVLKNLRYRCLAIRLDGAIDGEFVTRIEVDGINQGSELAKKSFLARPFLGLPFLFNVRIEAPFRGLLNTAASLIDPSALIRSSLGEQYVPVAPAPLAVQPADSDKGIEGKTK